MKITLQGNIREFKDGMTVKEIASEIAISLGKATLLAKLNNDQYVNLDHVAKDGDELEFITSKSGEEFEKAINYTAGLIAAAAVKKAMNVDIKIEAIAYKADEKEFVVDLHGISKMSTNELANVQKAAEEIMKTETINVVKDNYVLAGVETCVCNPIISDIKVIKAFEVQQFTGTYLDGDSSKEMLQRVHGMGAESIKALEDKKAAMEDRRSRDHRQINKTLNIFGFDSLVGAGLPLWLPNGAIVKEEIKKYLKEKEWEYDYIQVNTPVIGTTNLYKTSGHWAHYKDDMFQPFTGGKGGEEEFMLRPMNCPHHVAVYKQEPRSYRDLPLRIAEHAIQHRFESSGSLTGLERVRAMELTDSHIFVRPDQIETEFKAIYTLISEVLTTFNIEIDYLSLSLRDPEDKEKYFDDDNMWNKAEAELENVLKDLKLDYKKMIGEAAFYGPKLDIQIKTAQNHEITVSTIQLDFLLPERFDVNYIDSDGSNKRPIMIHRGLIGTYERFIATLMEQTKGVLPLWLAPNQVEIIPVNEVANDYADEIRLLLKKEFIRTHIDLRDERLSYKIREAQIHKTPYQLVLGANEIKDGTITYRKYGSEEQITVSKNEFVSMLKEQIKSKK